jgi:hypothetical protein
MLYLTHLEKQEQAKPKTTRRREKIKMQVEKNEYRPKKPKIQRINKTKSWFFEK